MLYAISSPRGPLLDSKGSTEQQQPYQVARLYGSRELALANRTSADLTTLEEVDNALEWFRRQPSRRYACRRNPR